MTLTLTTITREEALDLMRRGAQAKRAEIEESIRDLHSQLNGDAAMIAHHEREHGRGPKRRKMSVATRKRMAEAQRARWAKRKGAGK